MNVTTVKSVCEYLDFKRSNRVSLCSSFEITYVSMYSSLYIFTWFIFYIIAGLQTTSSNKQSEFTRAAATNEALRDALMPSACYLVRTYVVGGKKIV